MTRVRESAHVTGMARAQVGHADGGDLLQQFATFPASFPTDFLEKPVGKVAKAVM